MAINPDRMLRTAALPLDGLHRVVLRIRKIATDHQQPAVVDRAEAALTAVKSAVDLDTASVRRLVGPDRVVRPDHGVARNDVIVATHKLRRALDVVLPLQTDHADAAREMRAHLRTTWPVLYRADRGETLFIAADLLRTLDSKRFEALASSSTILSAHIAAVRSVVDTLRAVLLLGEPVPRRAVVRATRRARTAVDDLLAFVISETSGRPDLRAVLLKPVDEITTELRAARTARRAERAAQRRAAEAAQRATSSPPASAVPDPSDTAAEDTVRVPLLTGFDAK